MSSIPATYCADGASTDCGQATRDTTAVKSGPRSRPSAGAAPAELPNCEVASTTWPGGSTIAGMAAATGPTRAPNINALTTKRGNNDDGPIERRDNCTSTERF